MIQRLLSPEPYALPVPVSTGLATVLAATVLVASVWLVRLGAITSEPVRLLYFSLAVVGLGFTAALVYEIYALANPGVPTISAVAELAFQTQPVTWVAIYLALMTLAGGLVVHFTRVATTSVMAVMPTPWWLITLLGVAAFLLGAVVAYRTRWLA